MPTYLGEDGVVLVGAAAVANIENFSLNIEGSKVPTPSMGDTAIVEKAGKPRVNGRIRCWYDDGDTTGQGALLQGSSVALELRPRGTGSGLPEFTIVSAEIDTEVFEVPVEGGVTVEFGWSAAALPSRTAQV